jgi:hypothetical protein
MQCSTRALVAFALLMTVGGCGAGEADVQPSGSSVSGEAGATGEGDTGEDGASTQGDGTSGDDDGTSGGDGDGTSGDGDGDGTSGDGTSGDGDGTSGDGTSGDGDGTSGDGDGTSGDGDGTSGDGDGTSGDGDGTSGDGDGTSGDGDGTSGDGDGTSGDGDGDGCNACAPAGAVQCSPTSAVTLETCVADPTTGCLDWSGEDCTVQLSDTDAFCDPTTTPASCDLPDPCAVQNPGVSFDPPYVVMVLDHSGSMYLNDIAPGVTRWDGLVSVVDTVTQNYEDRINFGIKWFPSSTTECTTTGGKCDVTSVFDVNPAPLNNVGVMGPLSAMTNLGSCSTPTQSAMEQSLVAMNNFLPPGEVGAFMLIIDGGVATFCSGNTQAGTVTAVQNAAAAGFNTYVVGIDAGASADADAYAIAGGVPNPDPTYNYYPGDDLTALNTALDQIVGQISTCEIQLTAPPPTPDQTEVFVDGTEYFQIAMADCSTQDGWYYSSPANTSIMLCGSACTAFQSVLTAEVNYFCVAG